MKKRVISWPWLSPLYRFVKDIILSSLPLLGCLVLLGQGKMDLYLKKVMILAAGLLRAGEEDEAAIGGRNDTWRAGGRHRVSGHFTDMRQNMLMELGSEQAGSKHILCFSTCRKIAGCSAIGSLVCSFVPCFQRNRLVNDYSGFMMNGTPPSCLNEYR